MPMSFGELVANLFGIERQVDPQEMLGRFLPPSSIEMIPEADRPALASLARRSALSAYPAGENPMNAAQKTLVDMIKVGRAESDRKRALEIASRGGNQPIQQSVLAAPGNESGAPDFRTAASRLEQAQQNPMRDRLISQFNEFQSAGLFDYADRISEQIKRLDQKWSDGQVFLRNGKPVLVRQGEFGGTQELPYEAPPKVREVNNGSRMTLVNELDPTMPTLREFDNIQVPSDLVTASVLAGVTPTVDPTKLTPQQRLLLRTTVEGVKRAGAANTNISQSTEKTLYSNLATGVGEKITADHAGATAAISTLGAVGDIRTALPNAMTGVAAPTEQVLTRIADALRITGPDARARLASTATVIQNLAKAELDVAASMKGQGQITDAERALIKRAAGGDISMSASEINALMNGLEKTARWRIATHERNMVALKKNPNSASIVDFYQLPPIPQSSAAPPSSIDDAVRREIERRGGRK